MLTRLPSVVVLIAVLLGQSGCTLFDSSSGTRGQSLSLFKMRPTDMRNWNEDEEDPYKEVGILARGDRPLEHDPDPWFKRWFMSARARNIERSLGFD